MEADDNSQAVIEWRKRAEMSASKAELNAAGCKIAELKAAAARDKNEELQLKLDQQEMTIKEDTKLIENTLAEIYSVSGTGPSSPGSSHHEGGKAARVSRTHQGYV